mgnify:CR=1 FL=1
MTEIFNIANTTMSRCVQQNDKNRFQAGNNDLSVTRGDGQLRGVSGGV